MRAEITLVSDKPVSIYVDYQYMLASGIIKKIYDHNPEYAKFIHEKGYSLDEFDRRKYKMYTFSNLFIPSAKLENKQLISNDCQVSFVISSIFDFGKVFFKSLLEENSFRIGNQSFRLQSLNILQSPIFSSEMRFKTISPIHIRNQNKFLSPLDFNFAECIHKNLSTKYSVINEGERKEFCPTLIECMDKPVSKLITIKRGTPAQSQIKAYQFKFKISGDPELIKIGYDTGFGTSNSMGFGCVDLIES